MNGFIVNSIITESQKNVETSLLYIIIPVIIGVTIDLIFSQNMGTQFCSLNKTEYICVIYGIQLQQWLRELLRFIFQFGLILCALILLHKFNHSLMAHMCSSFVGLIGLILFFIVQPDLFSDFRRFFNGLVFSIKHN